MEYVGRRVRKKFQGHGTFFGSVQAYEPATGFFKIVYEDGDSEELELMELSSLLVSAEPLPSESSAEKPELQPKRRRRCIVSEGKDDSNLANEGNVCDNLVVKDGEFDLNLNGRLDLNDDASICLHDNDHEGNAVGAGGKLHGLDLNEGVTLVSDDGLCVNEQIIVECQGEKKEIIDLNLDVNGDFGDLNDEREGQRFDLNLQLVDDEVKVLDDYKGQVGANERVSTRGHMQMKEEMVEDDRMGNCLDEDKVDLIVNKETEEDSQLKNCVTGIDNENVTPVSVQPKRRGRKRKTLPDTNTELATSQAVTVDFETENMDLERRDGISSINSGDSVCHDNGNSESVLRKTRGRKRRELSDNDTTLTTPETGLRRSSRRAKRAAISGEDQVSDAVVECINHRLSSPAISIVSDEKIMVGALGKSTDDVILSPKVELPPSSCNFELNGVSLFDFLSVYTFLRSFSTLLFLSPFGLEDFVASVKSNDSTLIFDSAHVSLLRTLQKHLESLSVEGSDSASDCLRSLNWDFLDLITWPMFVVEYLLLYSPGYIPGLDLRQLKLYQDDYYKLPNSSKIEILRRLCDDVIETEAFRSELNRRMLPSDRQMDLERNIRYDSTKRRKRAVDVASTSCITEEDAEERADMNSDECCLCKMDGNLICCDGCPAAFHSRCVGVVSSLLPEGDWFCPECAIEKDKSSMKVGNKAIRGAELLDIDPYGRLYYSCYGYLLVLESCNDKSLCCAYNRNDLPTLIEVLESSPYMYDVLINAICKHWNVVRGVGGTKNDLDTRSCSIQSAFPGKKQLLDMHLMQSEPLNRSEAFSGNTARLNSEHSISVLETGVNGLKMQNQLASSEGSHEVSQTSVKTDNVKDNVLDRSKVSPEISDCHIAENGRNFTPDDHRTYGTNYVNCYEFARIAASYYEELMRKSLIKTPEDAQRSIEEIIAGQLKVVSNRFADFSWSNIQNSVVNFRKERCGWCVYCRAAEGGSDCLFTMNDHFPAVECFTCEALGIRSRKNLKSHLIDVICHIICIEDHLQGLLVGPWLNPGYSIMWRKSVLETSDIASLKNLLLELESNLHHRSISADWTKHVDSVATMGSASHMVSTSVRASSKYGIGRKRAKSSEVSGPSSNAATGLSLFWWRGGRGSRALFNWKVLPRSLACKAARQGGRKRIPGILYPESGEYAKRTKFASWRAAIETSRSVEQLALQVRELDANIRWDDIGNTNLLSKIEQDSKKPARSFKKVIVRRKCTEGAVVKYLLDFGKRRFIPDIVVKHGSRVEDSSSDKKKFWLEESHVPLYLLKSFEEKRIARKSNNMKSEKLCEKSRVVRKAFQERGFSYLFSRAEKLEKYQCGHCKKDVLIREAVSCQHCEGFFHKRHARKTAGSIITECKYTCHKCQDGGFVKIYGRKGISEPPKNKNSSKGMKLLGSTKGKKRGRKKLSANLKNKKRVPVAVPLRRSARNAERTAKFSLQNTKPKKRKKGKKAKSEKGKLKKPKTISWKKMRTPIMSSYWLNGLRLSRMPDNERSMHFRSRMLLVLAGEETSVCDKPKCSLCCEVEYKAELNYVCCEICGDWYHGDALDLRADKIENLIGFKCHTCLKKRPPTCPHQCSTGSKNLSENKAKTETTGGDSDCSTHPEDGSALNDNSKDTCMAVNMEKQLPEEVQIDDDFTSSEKVLLENGSIKPYERKGKLLDAVETQSNIPN